ncbi:hypothetical protein FACS1894139_05750 [Planctomycetales bacterium]|nr:hypothetical protein FACS1894107_05430 [Planctomycetales bacterium]GHT00080.1 hypothetical protein FACS1894108_11360 [Planctomycetales bacterium]GHT04125.1 hypothetical protein FACS1894139_05750 [Planctomycetales bacterium]
MLAAINATATPPLWSTARQNPPPSFAAPTVARADNADVLDFSVAPEITPPDDRAVSVQVRREDGKMVIQMTDPQSGDLIQSIPSAEMLAVMERLTKVREELFA